MESILKTPKNKANKAMDLSKLELLSPAGDLEKLKMAVLYGADAVYLAGKSFGLRAQAANFSIQQIREGIEFAHSFGCKVYIALNIFARDEDIKGLPEFLNEIIEAGADAVIVSDPGVFDTVRKYSDDLEIHISTQANVTNSASVNFWHSMGAKRIILARELTLNEIRTIRENANADIDLEAFVHGAMCISYSGRCLLSNYMTGRDSNRGACAQPCRWKYTLMEEKRPGEYMPVFENELGTFILNSKDLCMIDYLEELADAGITSFKIEGRMKSVYYTALVTRAYRDRMDIGSCDEECKKRCKELVMGVSHRPYGTGFYFGANKDMQIYESSSYISTHEFVGVVKGYDNEKNMLIVEQRNNFKISEDIEIVPPVREALRENQEGTRRQKVETADVSDDFCGVEKLAVICMYNSDMEPIESAPHPTMTVLIPSEKVYPPYSILRKTKV